MSVTVYVALYGWVAVALALFALLPARRAMLLSFLGGWLFLPVVRLPMAGLPDVTKYTVIALATLLGAAVFDGNRLLSFRPRWFDLPALLWCLWPMPSALANDMGPYEGLAASLTHFYMQGIPYFLGRVYFADRPALVDLLVGICVAGLVYMPLCWYELRMSPTLHRTVYGIQYGMFEQTRRGEGWRPQVFTEHGLVVGMLLTTSALAALGLWLGRSRGRVLHLSAGVCTAVLAGTALLCRSVGALALLLVGSVALVATRRGRTAWPVWALLAAAPGYVLVRATGVVTPDALVALVGEVANPRRTESFEVRVRSEDPLIAKAKERMLLGWGPWGHYREDAGGADLVKFTDGQWIITMGKYGLAGLVLLFGTFLLPAVLALRTRAAWGPDFAVCVTGAVIGIYLLDLTMNSTSSTLYGIVAGALASAAVSGRALAPGARPAAPTTAAAAPASPPSRPGRPVERS